MRQLFTLEWYFSTFVVEVYKRMRLKSDEPWLTPDEMYQSIREADSELFEQIKSFFELYEEWYKNPACLQAKDKAIKKRKEIADYVNRKYGEK